MFVPVEIHARGTGDQGEYALGDRSIGDRRDVIELAPLGDDQQTNSVVLLGEACDRLLAGNLGAQLVEAGLDAAMA
ncbi:Uncharacterised protein [Mycobacteroides abscessus]|nr:Uncharacterised protein [Mycobacteroides abscessus]